MTDDVTSAALPVVAPTRKAVFIGVARHHGHSYGASHPLSIPRVSLTQDLIESYGALSEAEYLPARCATTAELEWFHTSAYVRAMRHCEALEQVQDSYRRRHHLGTLENPYFPRFFTIPATAAGASVQAAEQVLGGRIAFNPAGGMHHAAPDQARGFCYFNDTVLAVKRLRRAGLRVLYLDIDAHHGDGVEWALRDDAQVLTFSLHMDTGYAYPFRGGGCADWGRLGNAVNVPLPMRTNDTEYRHAFCTLWPAVLECFRPEAVVLQAGADMLYLDPLGKFDISNRLFLEVVERVVRDCPAHGDGTPRLVVTGGGGYHPLGLARGWLGVWGVLSGRQLPGPIPTGGQALLRAVGWDPDEDEDECCFEVLVGDRLDAPRGGPVREEVAGTVRWLLESHPLFRRSGNGACHSDRG